MPRKHSARRDFFAELMREVHEITSSTPAPTTPPPTPTYAPSTWLTAGLVHVIHVSDDGSQTDVGLFEELHHAKPPARRFVRAVEPPAPFALIRTQYVMDSCWTGHFERDESRAEVIDAEVHHYWEVQRARPTALSIIVQARNQRLREERLKLEIACRRAMRKQRFQVATAARLFNELDNL